MAFPQELYRVVKLPAMLLSLLLFVLMLAILQSGRDEGQRVSFFVVATLLVCAQLGWAGYQVYRVYTLSKHTEDRATVVQYVDSWLGLMLAWGMMEMAFWVLDTTPGRDYYWANSATLSSPGNDWVSAMEWVFDAVHIMTATSSGDYDAHQYWPRLVIWSMEVVQYFYLPLAIGVVSGYMFDQEREARKARKAQHKKNDDDRGSAAPLLPQAYVPQYYVPQQTSLPPHLRT
jgi:hypothetical protein